MYSLTSNLSMATQALEADDGALAITNNNISNVNTPGYSRELVNLSSSAETSQGTSQDNGVSFGGYTSVRDEVLQIGIDQKTADSSSLSTQSASWSQIEGDFSGTGDDLGSAMSTFFSDLSALSTDPGSAATQQTALSAAGQLADAFNQAASTLSTAQSSANANVTGTVAQINQLSTQIAALNGQLATLQASGQDGGSVEDQRDELTTQLAQLVGVSSTSTSTSPTLTTTDGSPLVIGNTAYALQVTQGGDGTAQVLNSQGQNITGDLTGGSLGGDITMRDQSIPQVSSTLDQLATQFANAINSAQAQGYDQSGNAGEPMFTLPADGSSAAAGISLALTNPASIATSSDGSAGSSGNLANLLAVQTDDLPSGQTPSDAYAGLTESIGSSSAAVTSNLTATTAALTQLTTQQGSESGVSVDEETTNLLRYQQAYSASAQVITTVNDLFSVLMNMNTVTS